MPSVGSASQRVSGGSRAPPRMPVRGGARLSTSAHGFEFVRRRRRGPRGTTRHMQHANAAGKRRSMFNVIARAGRAVVGKRRVALKRESLLRTKKGEAHQTTNTGRTPLVTLNFYAPP